MTLDIEQVTALDIEGDRFSPANQAPRMVCLSLADWRHSRVIHRKESDCIATLRTLFSECLNGDRYIAGQHIAFDLAVIANEWPDLLPVIFRLYDAGRVLDTTLRQKLIDIGRGEHIKGQKYNLGVLAKRHSYPGDVDKENPWRLRYVELIDTPVSAWPREAVDYSEHDSLSALHVIACQEDQAKYLEDQHRQARAAWALHLISVWGIRTDRIMVAKHRRDVEARLNSYRDTLSAADLIYQDKKGEWHRRAKVAEGLALTAWHAAGFDEVPRDFRTASGKASLNADSMEALKDPLLLAYSGFANATTTMGHVEELEQGIDTPLHTRWDTILENGRTSSSGPNIQNREVEPGDRECFVPRQGNVFLDGDVGGLELASVCQVMLYLGLKPLMADALNEGRDPHAMYAAEVLGCDYDTAKKRCKDPDDKAAYLARQTGKINNFGRYGGMGDEALRLQARAKYGIPMTLDEIKASKVTWHATWPEAQQYFAIIRRMTEGGGAWVEHFMSHRWRGDCRYTQAANTLFSGLGADATKAATYALVKECYVGDGVLRGSRVVDYIHDQWITEVPDSDQLTEFAEAKRRIVDDAVNEWLPDVKTTCAPFATRRWSKLAKRTVDARGRLIPWEWDVATAEGSPGHAT